MKKKPTKLKPCPFCGCPPESGSRPSEYSKTGETFNIRCFCDGCVATAWQSGDTLAEVTEKWNRRKP